MKSKTGTTQPSVRLIQDIPQTLVLQIRHMGAYRCGVLVPDCGSDPVAEVVDTAGIHRLLCRQHTYEYCAMLGLKAPAFPQDGN